MISRPHRMAHVLVFGVVVLGLTGSAAAREDSPNYWGLGTNFLFVSGEEFQSTSSGTHWTTVDLGSFWRFSLGTHGRSNAAVRLPTGSLVTGMTIIYYDGDGGVDRNISLTLFRAWVTAAGVAGATQVGPTFESSGAPGVTAFWVDIDPDHTIQYIDGSTAQSYVLDYSSPVTHDLSLRGVIIGWNRQVSPAPGTATFGDVGTGHWAFQFVEALAASGITGGCGGGNFCPNNPITRAEMAVFLSGALGLHWAP